MYKIIYMGGYIPRLFEEVAGLTLFELVGVIIDYSLPNDEIELIKRKMSEINTPELNIDDIPRISPDIIFMCGYTKILKSELINRFLFINIHAGILPKWRGFNANCWAILNGETKVGYTIHRVRDGLDAGEIYKIISVNIDKDEVYADARDRIKEKLCKELQPIFVGVIRNQITPICQKEEDIIYNSKLRKSDGEIHNWNYKSTWINGLLKVFGTIPKGTGVKIYIKGEEYSVVEMEIAEEIGASQGIPGSVINKYSDGSVLIKTMDTAVRIKRLRNSNCEDILPSDVLRIGMRL